MAAPSAGNTYSTGAFTLRTPTSGAHTFLGDSLSIDAGGILAYKTPGIVTVNNLILNGGTVSNFDVGGTQIATLNGSINLAAASAFDSSVSGRTIVVNSIIGGNAPLTLNGVTGITLAGNNNYTGATTSNVGTLTVTNSNALGATGVGNHTTIVGANGTTGTTLALAGSALTINEAINFNASAAGRAGLIQNNTNLNHTLAGPIDVSSTGTLVQWNSTGSGSITVTGDITGNMTGGSVLFLRGTSTSTNNRILGSLNLTGGDLAKTDTGTWVIGAAGETYSWVNTRVAVGTLRTAIANMLPSTGTITIGQNDTLSAVLDLAGNSQTTTGITFNYGGSAVTSTGQITTGAGTLTLNGNLTYNTAALYNGAGGTISGLLSLGGGTRTFTINDGLAPIELTVSAAISNGALTKAGLGTLRLSGANTYAGNTTINAGTLALGATGSIDNSPIINVAAGAFYNVSAVSGYDLVSGQTLAGNGTVVGNVITDAGSTISPGGANALGTLTFNGNLDIDGTLLIELNSSGSDLIIVNGALDITNALLDFSAIAGPIDEPAYIFADYDSLIGTFATANVIDQPGGYYINYAYQGNQIALVALPEPATMSLLALGGVAMLRRRRDR